MKERFAEINTIILTAGEVRPAKFQLSILPGLFSVNISGLRNQQTQMSLQRVMSSLKLNAYELPRSRLIGRIEPVDCEKIGAGYDLPLAILILCASNQIKISENFLSETLICGEFDLTGQLCAVRGVLAALVRAKEFGIKRAVVPSENLAEARLAINGNYGLEVIGVSNLSEAVSVLAGKTVLTEVAGDASIKSAETEVKLKRVIGQESAKFAMSIAIAGNHPMLMIGSPGCGKSSLAHNARYLMPALDEQSLREVREIYSYCSEGDDEVMFAGRPPYVAPHHSTTVAALMGGGSIPQPGLCSKAHNGILFLDELCEFSPACLAALREVLEEKYIHLRRQRGRADYPADFLLVAATNPCPCGFALDRSHKCTCSQEAVQRYLQKIRGPLLDRFQLTVVMDSLKTQQLFEIFSSYEDLDLNNEREHIKQCREFQQKRNLTISRDGRGLNADIDSRYLSEICKFDAASQKLLDQVIADNSLTARNFSSLLKVSRTCADWDCSEKILAKHILLASYYYQQLEV